MSVRPPSAIISSARLQKIPAQLLSIPITSRKSYIYYKHTHAGSGQKVSLEDRVVGWASRAWMKLETSDLKVNKNIVLYAHKLLDRIPWDEGSLRSIPARKTIAKEFEDNFKKENQSEYDDAAIGKMIPLFYPEQITNTSRLHNQLVNHATMGNKYHFKMMVTSLIVLPFTLPLALVPVVPNIPGFYLAYRAYCHFKAYSGAKHLDLLLGEQNDGYHLKYIPVHNMLKWYRATKDQQIQKNIESYLESINNEDAEAAESILLSEEAIETLTKELELPELISPLKMALKQEKSKLAKQEESDRET
ncbi:BA75_01224T0 [Komagataella pastoris]|uniref:BA75_01224T0 n=1 Tax=Komagataella pastoris TaxID=4922 RepID=A0A1B2J7R1_PICPA|nr:BA75_01224T0 [Komagataella pastoris]